MRPVERGLQPLNPDGTPRTFREYQDARADLITRLGEYCSYCEMHLDSSLAVEHVQPKKGPGARPELALDWVNFLLGCTNCNSTKGTRPITLTDYYWPDSDNTLRMLEYSVGGIVQPHPDLLPEQQARALRMIQLVGLDHIPGTPDLRASDRRWNNRREAWDRAERARSRLAAHDTAQMREQIVETAEAKGYWSIWMTVFADDPDMRRRLIAAFPGTAAACFDDDCLAITRPGGNL